jgi:hypothetical protein
LLVLHFELVKGELDPPSRVSGKALFELVCVCSVQLRDPIRQIFYDPENIADACCFRHKQSPNDRHLDFTYSSVCFEAPHNLPQTVESEASVDFENSPCRLPFHSIFVGYNCFDFLIIGSPILEGLSPTYVDVAEYFIQNLFLQSIG